MDSVTRRAFRGYTFQQQVYTFFIAKMDIEREISSVNAEMSGLNNNMDDIEVMAGEKNIFRIQAKNYKQVSLNDIRLTNNTLTICGNKSELSEDINIFVIRNTDIHPDSEVLGMAAYKVAEKVYIVPLPSDDIANQISDMYGGSPREAKIIHLAFAKCTDVDLLTEVAELPPLKFYSTTLEEETVKVRSDIESIQTGILCVVGKPGIGKSHFVNEITESYFDAIVYRFWTGAQDKEIVARLQYNNFLADIAYKVTGSPKAISEAEIVGHILHSNRLIIIDGLDHVENYNPHELDKYIGFVNKLNDAKVLILTRPLKVQISWKCFELNNWTENETHDYLGQKFKIQEYGIVRKIYAISNGYPIITDFLAKHYVLNGAIEHTKKIDGLNDYYDGLLRDTSVVSLLRIFLINNSYFTRWELSELLDEVAPMLFEFVDAHPYLFSIHANRISLIHDSLNTYLKSYIPNTGDIQCYSEKIKVSIEKGEVRYLARISNFGFDKPFIGQLLQKYACFDNFKSLINSTLDWEAVTEFYDSLKNELQNHSNLFDIYEYYSFILLTYITNRQPFEGGEALLYQQVKYFSKHGIDEECINSSGVLWNVFLMANNHSLSEQSSHYERALEQYEDLWDKFYKEEQYFDPLQSSFNIKNKEKVLENINEYTLAKREILSQILVHYYITAPNHGYGLIVKRFLAREKQVENELSKLAAQKGVEPHFAKNFPKYFLYYIHTLGLDEKSNPLLSLTLGEVIDAHIQDGSFTTYSFCLDYIRLANHQNRIIDIKSLKKYCFMYYRRKDYTVYRLPEVLTLFEKKGLISLEESINIIENAMDMSEKGIRHLLTSFVSLRTDEFNRLLKLKVFDSYNINTLNLPSEVISQLPENKVADEVGKLLRYHSYSKSILFTDIEEVLHSKYYDKVIGLIHFLGYTVEDVPLNQQHLLAQLNIELAKEDEEVHVPSEYGYIHEQDFDYLRETKTEWRLIAQLVDGWYRCLPYWEAFNHFDPDIIKENICQIIHFSMYTVLPRIGGTGNWSYYLSNIPLLAEQCGYLIDWNRMFAIFEEFLDISLIGKLRLEESQATDLLI